MLLSAAGHTLTTTQTCSSFDIFYTNNTAGLKFTVSIDGGAAVVVTQSGSPSGYGLSWNGGALTPGSHTVVTGYEATSSGAASIEGAMFYNGDETKGIRLWDGGHAGFTSASFSGNHNWRAPFAQASGPTPDDMLLALGYNDMRTNMLPATFKANIQTVTSKIRESRPRTPIIILANPARPQGAFTYPWSDYLTAMQEIADAEVFTTLLGCGPVHAAALGAGKGESRPGKCPCLLAPCRASSCARS